MVKVKRLLNVSNNYIKNDASSFFHLIHSATKKVVDYCIKHNISRVIVGDIKNIRDDADLGKQNNQKLHKLPFDIIYHQLEYKLNLQGITLIKKSEKYTSQCSPYSKKVTKKYGDKSNRIKRGLYVDKNNNQAFNADSVGSFNILRKYLQQRRKGKDITLQVKGLSNPVKYSWNDHQFAA
ncbi:IS200/IS605 family accessory protein TnpB-related protein [Acetohalobium arabaticum]|uniref:IS200/IS605 family accessory protein TnpB-related protein n=1 Tax=Acetohalobium arabaticum TaxID=28187 RepID=UPI000309F159|nr:IS200/IS605 family accessory protein TnpB-related protein [Acetohalobium arabaticum]